MLPIVHEVVYAQGTYKKKLGSYFEWVHNTHIVSCHVRSGGNYIAGKEALKLRSPYLAVMTAGERDANGLVGPYEMFWCAFEWDGVQSDGHKVGVNLGGARIQRSHIRALHAAELHRVVEIYRELQSISRSPDLPARLLASAKVVELLSIWASQASPRHGEDRAVRLYRNLIEQYASESGISLEELAKRVGMSVDHLGVLFHKEVGMAPVEYRTQLRLLRARELLANTARPISAISKEVGFQDFNYFGRVFRRRFGMSPRAFASAKHLPIHAGSI